jgi:indolepyruvate ferredoxin oxidoreductase alpha subunit
MPTQTREPVDVTAGYRQFNALPAIARGNYDRAVTTRLPALTDMVERSPLNRWEKGSRRVGVITYGICDLFVREVTQSLDRELDVLSWLVQSLPMQLINPLGESIDGPYSSSRSATRFSRRRCYRRAQVYGKTADNPITEWSPAQVAERLGLATSHPRGNATPVPRPPAICPGCPYRLFALEVAAMKKKGLIDVVFGDIGCYALLYFLNAVDTALCMGAGEAMRQGFVLSRPEEVSRCLAVVGDSTECHTGMAATRNAVLRNIAGVKVILDNSWTAMTGGQPSPTSPHNLAGQEIRFDLPKTIEAHGARTHVVAAYDRKAVRTALTDALADAKNGAFSHHHSERGTVSQAERRQHATGQGRSGYLPAVRAVPHLPRPREGPRRLPSLESVVFRLRRPHTGLRPDVSVRCTEDHRARGARPRDNRGVPGAS